MHERTVLCTKSTLVCTESTYLSAAGVGLPLSVSQLCLLLIVPRLPLGDLLVNLLLFLLQGSRSVAFLFERNYFIN